MAQIGLILGVAGGAAKLSISLYSIAAAIGTAGVEVRTFASNASSLAQVLTTLSDALETKESVSPRAKTIADGLIALCQTILDDSNKLLKKLQPLVQLTGTAQKRFLLRIIWIFEKSKFATHVQSLETLKSTLSLLVGTVNYSEGIAVNRPRDIQISLRVQLQNIALEVQNGNRGHQNVTRLMQRESRLSTQNLLGPPQGSQLLQLEGIPNGSIDSEEDELRPVGPGPFFHTANGAVNTLALEPGKIEQSIVVHSKEDEEETEEEVERKFGLEELDVFTPYLEISLLQRKTVQFATHVLQAEEDGATTEDTNDQSPGNSQDGNQNSSTLLPKEIGPSFNMGTMNGTLIYNTGKPESPDQQQGVPSSGATSTTTENAPATEPKEIDVVQSLGIIKFTDSRGRKYDLPLNHCRTWEGIASVLTDIYEENWYWGRNMNSVVEKRNEVGSRLGLQPFVLLGSPEYSIIIPRHWSSIVHSDYLVTMRFDNPDLNEGLDPRVKPDPIVEGSQRLVAADESLPHRQAIGKRGFWEKILFK